MELLYHYDKEVKLLRTFLFKDKLKAEIKYLDGKKRVLNRAELSESPTNPSKKIVKQKPVNKKKTELEQEKEVSKSDKKDTVSNKIIVAVKVSNNRKTNLGTINSDGFKKFVKKNKLDKEAIDLVLSGKQKTHKGFTFSFK